MTKKRILVEYIVDSKELELSREEYHALYSDQTVSDAVVFADDLQAHAHDGEGCLYGHFTVLSVRSVEEA
jgi:hypothetical protein